MDGIANLLKDRAPREPTQVHAIKHYVAQQYNATVVVTSSKRGYGIITDSPQLATVLRYAIPAIERSCDLDKKLFITIGSLDI